MLKSSCKGKKKRHPSNIALVVQKQPPDGPALQRFDRRILQSEMQHFSRIRTFMLELDAGRGPGIAYRGGELLSGRVVLDVAKGLKVRALAVCARGLAATHWLESKSFGMNTVYSDYTAYETYLRRRQHLIRGERVFSPCLPPGVDFLATWAGLSLHLHDLVSLVHSHCLGRGTKTWNVL